MTRNVLAVAAAVAGCGFMVVNGQQATPVTQGAMPAAQQNALVAKYCAVCHTDASMNGGLSLEHFDAAHADPGVAAMMVGKLKAKAMGASGIPLPDRATQDALQAALTAEAAGAGAWTVNRTRNPKTQAQILTASVVRELPSAAFPDSPDLYRLKLTCRADTHAAEMQLAWSPAVPEQGRVMSAAVDGKAPAAYKIDGLETNGNGQAGTSGPGSMILAATQAGPLPAQTLTVSNLFPNETVVFPFGELAPAARLELSACFRGQ